MKPRKLIGMDNHNTNHEIHPLQAENAALHQRIAELEHALHQSRANHERTQDALRSAQSLLQSFLDHIPAAIFVKDLDGRMLLVNTLLSSLLNLDPKSIIGRYQDEIFPPDVVTTWKQQDRHIVATGESIDFEVPSVLTSTLSSIHIIKFPILNECGEITAIGGISLDISDRVQAEELYHSLVEQSLFGLVIFQHGRFVFVNPAMCDVTGYTRSELLAFRSQDIRAMIHPKDREWVWQRVLDRAQGKSVPTRYEFRIIRKDRSVCWIEKSATIIHYQKQPASLISFIDVTERKHNEDQLRFQSHILNVVGQAIIATSSDGTITYWNNAAENLYGWSSNDVIGHNILDVTPSDLSHERAAAIMHELQGGTSWTGEFIVRHRNERNFPAMVTNVPLFDDEHNFAGVIGVSYDISEQKQMESALEEERARFHWVVEHAKEGFVIVDDNGIIHYANRQARLYLDIAPDVSFDSVPHDSFLNRITKHYHCHPLDVWEQGLFSSQCLNNHRLSTHDLRYLIRPETATSHTQWLQVEVVDLPAATQKKHLIRLRDVSDQMTTQRHMWTFQSLISHKLNTPMSCLINSLYLLQTSPNEHLPPQAQEYISIASNSAHMLQNQLQSIRYFATASDLARPGEQCMLTRVPDIVVQIGNELDIHTIAVSHFVEKEVSLVLSGQAVSLIFRQLLDNAKKFHPTHMPLIEIVLAQLTSEHVMFQIKDDGVHLTPEQLSAACIPYYQLEKDFVGRVPGMGLGLAIVASLLWSVGGHYRIDNCDASAGVMVEVTIPLVQE